MDDIKDEMKDKILEIRGQQVILGVDLARLYGVKTKRINEQVKRNQARFPEDFCFQLTDIEKSDVVANCDHLQLLKYSYKMPYAFTEQGVAMLSSVLNSIEAIKTSLLIMRAFVAMRRFISRNAEVFQRLGYVERKQIEFQAKTEESFERVFNALERKYIIPEKRIFFDGQVFDAYKFASDLIKSAKFSIILIDNYIDDSVFTLMSNKKENITATIYTANISEKLKLAQKKFNEQYKNLNLKEFSKSHDRFLIIDNQTYHIGASLKDLGKKWFAFSKFESLDLTDKLENSPNSIKTCPKKHQ